MIPMVEIGNFFFKHRNWLFIVFYAALFLPSPALFPATVDLWSIGIGLTVTIIGQLVRGLTIGLAYIVRGGKGGSGADRHGGEGSHETVRDRFREGTGGEEKIGLVDEGGGGAGEGEETVERDADGRLNRVRGGTVRVDEIPELVGQTDGRRVVENLILGGVETGRGEGARMNEIRLEEIEGGGRTGGEPNQLLNL